MSEIKKILEQLCWNYIHIEGEKQIDQALLALKTLIDGCILLKERMSGKNNSNCYAEYFTGYNEATDTMKSNLEKVFGVEKSCCWKCGKEGDFSGQVCDNCFDKMEKQRDLEIQGGDVQ